MMSIKVYLKKCGKDSNLIYDVNIEDEQEEKCLGELKSIIAGQYIGSQITEKFDKHKGLREITVTTI